MMYTFKDLLEAPQTVVFAFGRFNPPTIGHEKLIKKTADVAGSNKFRIYPSHTQNSKKDPLPYALKIAYMRKMFKKYAKNIIADRNARTAHNIAVKLYDEGFQNLVMVVGSDRVSDFSALLKDYNGVEGKRHGYYKFDNIDVVSAGARDPDAEGVEGMSASKMRAAAIVGEYDQFKMGLPAGFKDGKKLFRDIRKNMGIREEKDMGEMNDTESLRDAYLTGKIWNIDDIVEANGVEGRIVNRGTNYISFCDDDGKVHKAWLHDITLESTERNYRKEYDNYHSRPEQVARRSSRNKARRKMGEKTVKGMDVGHKDNNPLNNTPKNIRNEDPSKNRREPRLREDNIDEYWVDDIVQKLHQITHKKGYEKVIEYYVKLIQDNPKYRKNPTQAAKETAAIFAGVETKGLISYINDLVKKGKLPKELKAQYEEMTFSKFVNRINEVKQDSDIKDKEGTQPAKYHTDLAPSTKKKRDAHFKAKKSGPAPGDADAETKPSVHTKKYKQMYGEEVELNEKIEGLVKKAEKSGMPYGILKKVYDRGMAAYKTGHRPGTTAQQWAFARVNSFITKGSGTWGKADADLAKQVRGESLQTEEEMKCPPATQDLALNTKNRDATTKDYGYGPLNVDEPGDYWEKIAKKWDTTVEAAKKSRCANCVAFDISERMKKCLPGETSDDEGELGYCWMHHFKCHSARACHTWAKGGPIETDEKSHDWQERAFGKKTETVSFANFNKRNAWGEITEKTEHDGRSVELNNPTQGDTKKYKVYVRNDKGNVVKVEFGDPNMEIKRDNPKRRAAFRARHGCDNPGPKWKAKYWSCKFWSAKSVTDLMKG